jgi:hypothetical protein
MNQLSKLKQRPGIIRSKLQGAAQQGLRFFDLTVLAQQPAEPRVGDELFGIDLDLFPELFIIWVMTSS